MLYNFLAGGERDHKLWTDTSLLEIPFESEECVESSNEELPAMLKPGFRQVSKAFAQGSFHPRVFKVQQAHRPFISDYPKSQRRYECSKMARR